MRAAGGSYHVRKLLCPFFIGAFIIMMCSLVLPEFWLTVATFIGIYSLASLGLQLLLGYAGQPSLGHSVFFAFGAYGSAICITRLGWDPIAGLVVGMLASAVGAYILGFPLMRVRGHYLAISTLALAVVVQVLLETFPELTGGVIGIPGIPALGGSQKAFVLIGVIVLIVYLLASVIDATWMGTVLRAVGDDEIATSSSGIDPALVKTGVFVLSAMLTSLAGSLYAHFVTYINPEPFNVELSISFVTMMLVGGTGRVWGGLIGAIVVGILPALLMEYAAYSQLLYGAVLILVLLFCPKGGLGLLDRLVVLVKRYRWHSARLGQ